MKPLKLVMFHLATIGNGKVLSDRKRFINQKNIRIHMRDYREGQPHIHAARVGLDGLINAMANIGKRQDVVQAGGDFLLGESEQGRVHVDVFTGGEFAIEARAELEQRRHAAMGSHRAGGGRERPADDLQQSRFTRAVAADDADCLSFLDLERHIPKRPEFAIVIPGRSPGESLQAAIEGLLEPVLGLVKD